MWLTWAQTYRACSSSCLPLCPSLALQQPASPSCEPAIRKQQALSVHTPQQEQLLRQSGTKMQGRAALRPLLGSSALPRQSGMAMSFGNGTNMQGHAALSPFLGGSPPHAQHGAVPSHNSTIAGTNNQMQKPTFTNHKRPGPQLQPTRPPAAQAATTALKVRYLQRAHSILPRKPSFIARFLFIV